MSLEFESHMICRVIMYYVFEIVIPGVCSYFGRHLIYDDYVNCFASH